MSGNRPQRLFYLLNAAYLTAERSTCLKQKVGAIVFNPISKAISMGYNGAPSGLPHCIDVGCLEDELGHCLRAVHAELNSLLKGVPGSSLLVSTHFPCIECCKAIINYGIKRVIYCEEYLDPRAPNQQREMLISVGIRVEQMNR